MTKSCEVVRVSLWDAVTREPIKGVEFSGVSILPRVGERLSHPKLKSFDANGGEVAVREFEVVEVWHDWRSRNSTLIPGARLYVHELRQGVAPKAPAPAEKPAKVTERLQDAGQRALSINKDPNLIANVFITGLDPGVRVEVTRIAPRLKVTQIVSWSAIQEARIDPFPRVFEQCLASLL